MTPPAAVPKEDAQELLRRHVDSESESVQTWVKWFIGISVPIVVLIIVGVIAHEARLVSTEKDVLNIKENQGENKKDTNKRLERIEGKQDQILDALLAHESGNQRGRR